MNEKTMTRKGRHVTIIASPGTRLSNVTITNRMMTVPLRPPSPPVFSNPCRDGLFAASCADAPSATKPVSKRRRKAARYPATGLFIPLFAFLDDLGDLHAEPALFNLD